MITSPACMTRRSCGSRLRGSPSHVRVSGAARTIPGALELTDTIRVAAKNA